MKLKDKKGFTLVELLVAIAIIGVLAAIAVPSLFNNIEKSKVTRLEEDYNAIKTASLQFYTENNDLPAHWTLGPNDLNEYMDQIPTTLNIGDEYHIVPNKEVGEPKKNYLDEEMYKFNKDGSISSEKVNLKDEGDLFLKIRSLNNKPINISDKQLQKLCDDIGYENIFIFSKNKLYKGNILAIKLIDKI